MSLIPNAFLFESSQAIRSLPRKPGRRSSLKPLGRTYSLQTLQELDGSRSFATLKLGWHEEGLLVSCEVRGKQESPVCDPDQPETSDGLTLWIDTRNTPGVHRANRFCHQIVAMPTGAVKDKTEPTVQQLEIARCREKSPLAKNDQYWSTSSFQNDGYDLTIWIPANALNGYDPEQSPTLGFFYAVRDQECGLQTLSVGEEFPFSSDPSLWQSVELTDEG